VTVSIDSAASDFTPRHGSPMFECSGARIRAQCRHLATVVTISGPIDVTNADRVSEYSRRFILPDKPFVLDLSGVDLLGTQGIPFLCRVDEDCRTAGVQWALVASPAVTRMLRITNDDAMFPAAASVREALHHFAENISARRRLLLPLLSKSA
jgi:anti-anti-sigma factor